jgi:hypothetical protein
MFQLCCLKQQWKDQNDNKNNVDENLIQKDRGFFEGSCSSIFSFLCSVLYIIACPFVLFLLVIAFSDCPSIYDSDYPFPHLQAVLGAILN